MERHFSTIFNIQKCNIFVVFSNSPDASEKVDLMLFLWFARLVRIYSLIQKQAKNRNETGSNLSLGTRLTVLSKRLRRKRCCDATPDRCLECNRLTILTAHC